MISSLIRWLVGIAAFSWLVVGYLLQQWFYVNGELAEFDRLVQMPNILFGWLLLILAIALTINRDKESSET
jgi:uncharacterized protein with PQ loop repeat